MKTLIEMLAYRAKETPDNVAFTFVDQPCTYREMWAEINQFAAYLLAEGVLPGDRVVLTLPNSREFFAAFYGVQRVGAMAVPLFPGFGPARVLSIVKACGAKRVVIPSATPAEQVDRLKKQAAIYRVTIDCVADSEGSTATAFPDVQPDDVAFLQYTSGSTGNPKGVQLTHANLITNINQLIDGMEITADERFVSWLPVYHDMGLILKTMVPFYLAADVILLPTGLQDVDPWLKTIETHQATFTAAPDFAYRLCLRRTKHPEQYDLSSLRVALNAAEPVRQATIQAFEQAFGLQNTMVAGYGLAEATVGVSMSTPQQTPTVDGRGYVSVGPPFPEIELKIVDDNQTPFPAGEIGEIAIKSPANTQGYYNNPEATERLFWQDGYILSGDLGYLDDTGELFIVARKKNTIIQAGQTIYPREVEELVDFVFGIRYTAAVGIDRGRTEGEQVYIFAEIRDPEADTTTLEKRLIEIVQRIHDQLGFRPGRVYLVKPKTIPLTHNGKLQRGLLKERFLSGQLADEGLIVYPG
ncbi:MAG: AMP-binding protein [Chloroflexota bacterium]